MREARWQPQGGEEEDERQTGIEAPGGAADRQTDVWADGQMTAPEGLFSSLNLE